MVFFLRSGCFEMSFEENKKSILDEPNLMLQRKVEFAYKIQIKHIVCLLETLHLILIILVQNLILYNVNFSLTKSSKCISIRLPLGQVASHYFKCKQLICFPGIHGFSSIIPRYRNLTLNIFY